MATLRRGQYRYMNCPTPYCNGYGGRCMICGGAYSDCSCHSCYYDACICGCHAETWYDLVHIKPLHLLSWLWHIAVNLVWFGDTWWVLYGWRGR